MAFGPVGATAEPAILDAKADDFELVDDAGALPSSADDSAVWNSTEFRWADGRSAIARRISSAQLFSKRQLGDEFA